VYKAKPVRAGGDEDMRFHRWVDVSTTSGM
jgi:hypothetical protein